MLAITLASPPHFGQTDTSMSPKAPTFGEYPFQALCPGHGLMVLFRGFVFDFLTGASFAAFGGRHINTVFAVGGKNPVEAGQVYSRFRHQCRQLGNGRSCASLRPRHTVHPVHKIQRLKDDVGSAVVVGRLELVSHIP